MYTNSPASSMGWYCILATITGQGCVEYVQKQLVTSRCSLATFGHHPQFDFPHSRLTTSTPSLPKKPTGFLLCPTSFLTPCTSSPPRISMIPATTTRPSSALQLSPTRDIRSPPRSPRKGQRRRESFLLGTHPARTPGPWCQRVWDCMQYLCVAYQIFHPRPPAAQSSSPFGCRGIPGWYRSNLYIGLFCAMDPWSPFQR